MSVSFHAMHSHLFGDQDHYETINLYEAWVYEGGDPDVVVQVTPDSSTD